jgi:LuxR family maltose regulon positive regulatory protein
MPKTVKRLSPPVLPDFVLDRPEVSRAIDAAMEKEIVFVHAPAGFGKTLAMSMWLRRSKIAAAWIPLTIYDDSPSVFCRYFLRALAALDDGAAEAVRTVLDAPGFDAAPFEYFFKAVSAMPEDGGEGVIVLDDFHLLENESILKALPLMIRKLSPSCKIAVLSRLGPPASFSELALKGRIGEITDKDLRFTRKQIIGLYKGYGIELSADDALEVESKTGGWALGLVPRLLSFKADGRDRVGQTSGEQYINHYLESEVWDRWDGKTQEFLLRTSILEDLPPELCDRLCGCDSRQMLSRLMSSSGLIVRLSDGSYRYHHILRDFLRQMAEERHTELSPLYVTAARYMYKMGRFPAALDYYVKSGDYDALSDFVIRTMDYNFAKISAEECLHAFKNLVLSKVPAEILEKNTAFVPICTYVYWMTGNVDQMNLWFSKVRNLLLAAQDDQTAGTMLALLSLDPFTSPWEYVNKTPAGDMKMETVPSISITLNLPSFHRAMRDFSDYLADWDVLVPQIMQSFSSIVGASTWITLLGISCGILYEQNKLAGAKQYILTAHSFLNEQSHPELFFAAYMHIADILFAEGEEKEAWESVGKARTVIEKNALYLKKNLEAMVTKYRLYKGEKDAAGRWLSDYAVSDSEEITLYQIAQVLTTVRAQIAVGAFSPALILLARLERLALNCRRRLDRLETLILRAILLWRQRQRAEAVDTMREAVLLAQPCGYIRMFANEGAAVLPVLRKLYNAAATRPEGDALLNFMRELIYTASESAKRNPGITGDPEENPIRLSRQQKLMLALLASGRNNRQICEETGLKLNTVKAHLFKLYEKLDVNSATDAVLKARRMNLLSKEELPAAPG